MSISEVTRRDIIDALRVGVVSWSGRLQEADFLSRIYDLKNLPSHDGRFRDMRGDIGQHRVNNNDWDDDWVYHDSRLDLLNGSDEVFLRFLCEMIHPLVRPDNDAVVEILAVFNEHLRSDGWEIAEGSRLSGKPIFVARQIAGSGRLAVENARVVAVALDAAYIHQQITRMDTATDDDPELAIGTAKEFVETVCKTILTERTVDFGKGDDFPRLVRMTLKELKLAPDDIPGQAKAAETIRILLQNLATVANGLAELRNPFGTGHGKPAHAKGLRARHARLAVGAATTLGVFLFDTYKDGMTKP